MRRASEGVETITLYKRGNNCAESLRRNVACEHRRRRGRGAASISRSRAHLPRKNGGKRRRSPTPGAA
ncbi:hypothetical protein GN956_G26046 [Arapaima gigas]